MSEQIIFKTIREQIVHRLRDDVLGQVFKPGEDLREYALAKKYGVSRSPVRDALLQLTQEGLLVATPNCGVKVGSPLEEEIQPLVIDIRIRLEEYALKKSLSVSTSDWIPELQTNLKSIHAACRRGDLAPIIKSDMEFHQTIVESAENYKILGIWKQVTSAMMLHYERHVDWMESYAEHVEIFEAIKKNDLERALEAIRTNIQ